MVGVHGSVYRVQGRLVTRMCWLKRTLFVALAFGLFGCAPATLKDVLYENREASVSERAKVQIIRAGKGVSTQKIPLALKAGDEIETDARTTAVLEFPEGVEVVLIPKTRVRISSFVLLEGTAFVRVLKKLSGLFEVQTEYVAAGVSGTEFVVSAKPNKEVTVTVLEGTVGVRSNTNAWPQVNLATLEQAVIRGSALPEKKTVDRKDFNALVDRSNQIHQVTKKQEARLLVPDVRGLTESQAAKLLTRQPLLVGKTELKVTGRSPVGTIVEQTPRAGTRVGPGTPVRLGIEAEPAEVPSVLRLPRQEAERLIRQRRLQVGDVRYKITGKAPAENVIGQKPMAPEIIPVGSSIDLIIEAESVRVPNLEGRRRDDVDERLARRRLRVGRVSDDVTGRERAGVVLRQDPSPETLVSPGTQVDIVVEAKSTLVPNVERLPLEDAKDRLRESELRVGRIDKEMTGDVSVGAVLSQRPRSGERVRLDTRIALVVEEDSVLIPDVEGLSLSRARAKLTDRRLRLGRVREELRGDAREGTVLRQSERAERRVRPNTEVDLVVQAPWVEVPDVVGLSLSRARDRLRSSGLKQRLVDQRLSSKRDGTILEQSPRPGRRVEPGTEIELVDSIQGVRVPNVVGMKKYEAQSLLRRRGLRDDPERCPPYAGASEIRIVGQDPDPGEFKARGTPVTIVCRTVQ